MSVHILFLVSVLLCRLIPLSSSQTLSNLPECWQACITSANNFNCASLDIACVCRAWNGGVLVSALSCITSTCDPSLDLDLLISPLELTCDLAGVPIASAVVSSALRAATPAAILTQYVTDTVTESYYWQSTFATVATTVIIPVTGSDGHTVIVAFPVTIEPSTTIYGSPSTSTPEVEATSRPTSSYSFGSCSNPGIVYSYGLDGESQFAFEPADQDEFPHGASPDIATIESFICNHLRDTCHAPAEAQKTCDGAFNAYSGLAGQNAADVWNIALGLPATTQSFTTTTVTVTSIALPTSSRSPGLGSVTVTPTTSQAQHVGNPVTITATATATVRAAGSSGDANADGGGSPFSAAIRERPRVLSIGISLILILLAQQY